MKNGLIYMEEGVLYVVYPGQISWVMDDIFRYYCSIVWFKQRRIILDSVVITSSTGSGERYKRPPPKTLLRKLSVRLL